MVARGDRGRPLASDSPCSLNAREHAYAFGSEAGSDYRPDDYAALRESQTILIDEAHDVFGDGACVIHAAPCHTPWHQVLLLTFPDQPPLLIVGDLYYSAADRTLRRIPVWNVDHAEALRSMDRIERLAVERGAHLFIHHDADTMVVFPFRTTGS